jgi:hypothetical protein
VHENNTARIEWGNHMIRARERAKHIDIRKHFAHEAIQNRQMRLIKVDSDSTHPSSCHRHSSLSEFTESSKPVTPAHMLTQPPQDLAIPEGGAVQLVQLDLKKVESRQECL